MMITSPLLSNVRHRSVITPESPLRTKAVDPELKFQAAAPPFKSSHFSFNLKPCSIKKIRQNVSETRLLCSKIWEELCWKLWV